MKLARKIQTRRMAGWDDVFLTKLLEMF